MANSEGGIIIYGVREYDEREKSHLPEKLDPIDRREISKEWLEQVISNIRPKIKNIIIHPVAIATGPADVAYVLEIPQSDTAHQATDYRYYRRFNFQAVAMADYEIRDVMNRKATPDALVEFKFKTLMRSQGKHDYQLSVLITNPGTQVIEHFALEFTFPHITSPTRQLIHPKENIILSLNAQSDYVINYRSTQVLFPKEVRDIGEEILWPYSVDQNVYWLLGSAERHGKPIIIEWTLYADNMTPKRGQKQFDELHQY